jgi:hypothetical protein
VASCSTSSRRFAGAGERAHGRFGRFPSSFIVAGREHARDQHEQDFEDGSDGAQP